MNFPDKIDVAVLGAVAQEIEPLFQLLTRSRVFRFRGELFRIGTYGGNKKILLGTTGLGKVNAAITTAALLEHFPIVQVWNIGCAGAYPGGPIGVGDVLITQEALCGDEGILTEDGALSTTGIGIPILIRENREFYDSIPLHEHPGTPGVAERTPSGLYRLADTPLPAAARFMGFGGHGEALPTLSHDSMDGAHTPSVLEGSVLPQGSTPSGFFRVVHGPSLTVGMVSGDPHVAGKRFRQYGAFAENMEGSAVAQTCFRFDTPVVECRGMSNVAGDRCRRNWRIERAMAHCHGIIVKWLMVTDDDG